MGVLCRASPMRSDSPGSIPFFSSRRRHTRWNCDWSSDVCSSDLGIWDCPRALRPWHRQRPPRGAASRSEEHTSELQSQFHLVCRLLLVKIHHLIYRHSSQLFISLLILLAVSLVRF